MTKSIRINSRILNEGCSYKFFTNSPALFVFAQSALYYLALQNHFSVLAFRDNNPPQSNLFYGLLWSLLGCELKPCLNTSDIGIYDFFQPIIWNPLGAMSTFLLGSYKSTIIFPQDIAQVIKALRVMFTKPSALKL